MRVFGYQFIKVGGPTERLTKKFESLVPGDVPGVGLMLIAAVLGL